MQDILFYYHEFIPGYVIENGHQLKRQVIICRYEIRISIKRMRLMECHVSVLLPLLTCWLELFGWEILTQNKLKN